MHGTYLASHTVGDYVVDSDNWDAYCGGTSKWPTHSHRPIRVDIGAARTLIVQLRILDDAHQENGLKGKTPIHFSNDLGRVQYCRRKDMLEL